MSISTIQNFYKETITRAVTLVGATNIYVSALPTPSEGYVVISPSSSTLREIVYYTAKGTDSNGTYLTVTLANRGLGGTTAQTHAIGEPVRMNVTAEHIKEISDAIDQIVAAGAQDASNVTKGITKLSVAPASATEPIAVGDNDTRLLGLVAGLVVPYAGSSAPTGWLLCDGSAVSRTTYASLFTAISTTYGVGDGSTTFNLPNLKGRAIVGAGTAATKVATFVSRASNVITVSGISDAANNEFQTGQAVLYSAPSGAMAGLTHNTTYYIIRTGNLTFSLATSRANAVAGTVISLSSDGTGTQTFTLTLTARTLGHTGGEENHAVTISEMASHAHSIDQWKGTGGSPDNVNILPGFNRDRNINGSVSPIIPEEGKQTPADNIRVSKKGGSGTHNNMQPFVVLNYIIKY